MTKWNFESEEQDPKKHWNAWKLQRDKKKIQLNNYLSAGVLLLATVVVVVHQGVI